MDTEPFRTLYSSNVFYLGHSAPSPGATGSDALIQPLRNAYPAHASDEIEGINAWLTIYPSGIQLQLVGSRRPIVYWFPIQNLYITAAMKCVNFLNPGGQVERSTFIRLTEPEASKSSQGPLFTFICKLNRGDDLQCYTFLTKNDETALNLVDTLKNAFTNKAGHSERTIPDKVAARETHVDSDSDGDSSVSVSGNTLRVINVDTDLFADQGVVDLFPRNLVKRHKLQNLRPQSSTVNNRSGSTYIPQQRAPPVPAPIRRELDQRQTAFYPPGPPRVLVRPKLQRPPQFQQPPQFQRQPSPQIPVQMNRRVIRPPPVFIRAPPPQVIHVREPPKVIMTPPKVIRQPYPVEKVVEKPVPVVQYVKSPTPPPVVVQAEPEIREVPVPVRAPTPEPRIVEVPVYLEQPPRIIKEPPEIREVMVPVRAETPEPRIVEVPVYMEGPTRIIREPPEIREIEVPVPYEVVIPPPPPEIREVPVFIETPPQIIREPPEVREVPVPIPYEVPLPPPPPEIKEVFIEKPVVLREPPRVDVREVPVAYPVPYEVPVHTPIEVPHFFPVPVPKKKSHRKDHRNRYIPQGDYQPRLFERRPEPLSRRHRRRDRSSSNSSDDSDVERETRPLRNGMSDMKITELDLNGRPYQRRERKAKRDSRRHDRHKHSDELVGLDFYEPRVTSRGDRRRRKSPLNYRVKDERPFSPSMSDNRLDRQMPAHLSDSVSELPRSKGRF